MKWKCIYIYMLNTVVSTVAVAAMTMCVCHVSPLALMSKVGCVI